LPRSSSIAAGCRAFQFYFIDALAMCGAWPIRRASRK